MSTFEQEAAKVISWALDKGILSGSTALRQHGKMVEEVYELKHAINKKEKVLVSDELGDVLVTTIVQAQMWGLDVTRCLADAVAKITKRDGQLIDGVFVKSEDLV